MKANISSYVDSNTGEKVSKCPISEDFQKEMSKVLNEHNKQLNNFMVMSQQHADLQQKWLDLRKELGKTDVKFKGKMQYIARKLKLAESDPWTYNMQDKCFELREPPAPTPMTGSEIKSGLAEKPVGT